MKWYQPIECDNTVKNPLVCDFSNLEEHGFTNWDFFKGEAIKNWSRDVMFQSKKKENDGTPDDVLQNADMIPIFSQRVIDTLNEHGIAGFQYLPVKVLLSDGTAIGEYFIANITNMRAAFDYEKSVYTKFKDDFPNPAKRGQISGVKKFVLIEKKLHNLDVVRLSDYRQRFFVSEKFRDLFVQAKLTGYSFREVEVG